MKGLLHHRLAATAFKGAWHLCTKPYSGHAVHDVMTVGWLGLCLEYWQVHVWLWDPGPARYLPEYWQVHHARWQGGRPAWCPNANRQSTHRVSKRVLCSEANWPSWPLHKRGERNGAEPAKEEEARTRGLEGHIMDFVCYFILFCFFEILYVIF